MITLYDDFPRDFDTGEPVFVKIDSLAVPLFLNRFERRGRKGAVVCFDDIDICDRASELTGLEFYIRTGKKEDEDAGTDSGGGEELYLEDLVGWDAEFGADRSGRITGFLDSELNPLFEIEINGAVELIPASDDFIAGFDVKRRKVVFSLPDGLLGLND